MPRLREDHEDRGEAEYHSEDGHHTAEEEFPAPSLNRPDREKNTGRTDGGPNMEKHKRSFRAEKPGEEDDGKHGHRKDCRQVHGREKELRCRAHGLCPPFPRENRRA